MNILQRMQARRHYRNRGYQVFRGAFSTDEIEALAMMIRKQVVPYSGLILRMGDDVDFNKFHPSTGAVSNHLINPHRGLPSGLEALSNALRRLITSRALGDRLQALDGEEHYTVHQTILFLSSPTTELHIDSWSLDTTPLGFSHTAWIPLQDMDPWSGVPSVVPWPRDSLLTEQDLGLPCIGATAERYERYQQALSAKVLGGGPEAITPLMRRGDFIVWSSLTPHFTLASRPSRAERLALQVLVRPTRRIWGNFIAQPPKWTIDRSLKVNDQFSLYFV